MGNEFSRMVLHYAAFVKIRYPLVKISAGKAKTGYNLSALQKMKANAGFNASLYFLFDSEFDRWLH